MPLPIPKKGETEKDFVGRCMATPGMKEEFPDPKQRTAVCSKQYRGKKDEGAVSAARKAAGLEKD